VRGPKVSAPEGRKSGRAGEDAPTEARSRAQRGDRGSQRLLLLDSSAGGRPGGQRRGETCCGDRREGRTVGRGAAEDEDGGLAAAAAARGRRAGAKGGKSEEPRSGEAPQSEGRSTGAGRSLSHRITSSEGSQERSRLVEECRPANRFRPSSCDLCDVILEWRATCLLADERGLSTSSAGRAQDATAEAHRMCQLGRRQAEGTGTKRAPSICC
jgi:hypothetical protein